MPGKQMFNKRSSLDAFVFYFISEFLYLPACWGVAFEATTTHSKRDSKDVVYYNKSEVLSNPLGQNVS